MGPCQHSKAYPQVVDGGRPPIWRVAVNILNKQSWTTDKCGPPAWGLGVVLTTPHCKETGLVMRRICVPWAWADPLV